MTQDELQSRAYRYAYIDVMGEIAHQENAALCKRMIESINRKFGQLRCHQVARMLRLRSAGK